MKPTIKEKPTVQPAALSTREAAAYLAISTVTLARLTKAGELPHLRIGRAIRYRREDLDNFLASRTTTEWADFVPTKKKA